MALARSIPTSLSLSLQSHKSFDPIDRRQLKKELVDSMASLGREGPRASYQGIITCTIAKCCKIAFIEAETESAMSHEPSSWHVYFRDLLKLFVQLFDLFAELLEWLLSLETSRHHDENAWYWLTTGIQQSKCRIRASEVSCACFKRLWSSSSLGEMWWFNPQTHRHTFGRNKVAFKCVQRLESSKLHFTLNSWVPSLQSSNPLRDRSAVSSWPWRFPGQPPAL